MPSDVIALLRVSSDAQAGADREGPPAQREACEALAAAPSPRRFISACRWCWSPGAATSQPGVAARAEALGVAHVIERDALTPETLAAAIRAVLENPSYTERAGYHSERLRAESPPARVRELVSEFMAQRARWSAG